jgi:hypothetical protein
MNTYSHSPPVRSRARETGERDSGSSLPLLQAAHGELETCIRELESITSDTFQEIAITAARMRIGAANADKHFAVREACAHLFPVVEPHEAEALRQLQEDNWQRVKLTSSHVRHWTAAAVADDWNGYCEAFRAIKTKVHDGIMAERRLLYPLLERN